MTIGNAIKALPYAHQLPKAIKRRCAGPKAHYVIGEEGRKQAGGDRL